MTADRAPALDIGGTHVSGALVAADAWQLVPDTRRERPLQSDGTAEAILRDLVACANAVGTSTRAVWGVATPGPFDYARGIGLFEGVAKFEALNGVDVRRALLDGIRPPASDVVFINDADAFLLGEWIAGAAVGHRRAAGITLGTGVGSAFLVDGEVVSDHPTVPPEGRVDLLTIGGRPLEETVSRRAILARYRDVAHQHGDMALDVRDIAERARGGEGGAKIVLEEAMLALGETLSPWLAGFGATVLVVGGSMSGSWDLLGPPLCAGTATAGPISVVRARHPRDAALIGAAWNAQNS